ncbi:MAG TPA: hypothetical protein VKC63_12620 [Solirubrobacterales bacterium]|nr:hypothetical protein [Solirubrobacterales bacterium]
MTRAGSDPGLIVLALKAATDPEKSLRMTAVAEAVASGEIFDSTVWIWPSRERVLLELIYKPLHCRKDCLHFSSAGRRRTYCVNFADLLLEDGCYGGVDKQPSPGKFGHRVAGLEDNLCLGVNARGASLADVIRLLDKRSSCVLIAAAARAAVRASPTAHSHHSAQEREAGK